MWRLGEGGENVKNFGFELDRDGTCEETDKGDQRHPLLILTHSNSTALILHQPHTHQHITQFIQNHKSKGERGFV